SPAQPLRARLAVRLRDPRDPARPRRPRLCPDERRDRPTRPARLGRDRRRAVRHRAGHSRRVRRHGARPPSPRSHAVPRHAARRRPAMTVQRSWRPLVRGWGLAALVFLAFAGLAWYLPLAADLLRPLRLLALVPGAWGTWRWLRPRGDRDRRAEDRRRSARR